MRPRFFCPRIKLSKSKSPRSKRSKGAASSFGDSIAGNGEKIHFEEFNQLLGRPAEAKYEGSYGEMAEFVRAHQSQQREIDIDRFFRRVLVCICRKQRRAFQELCALYTQEGFRLGPFYDIVAPSVYPRFRRTGMALNISPGRNPHSMSDIGPKHLSLLAKSFGLNNAALQLAVSDLKRQLGAAKKRSGSRRPAARI